MVFSDTSTRNGLIQSCEDWCGLGATGISGDSSKLAIFTRLINNRYNSYVTLLLQTQDEWDFDDVNHTDTAVITADLVATQQQYTIPIVSERILKIKRLEITYDGTTWRKAEPIDINEIGYATDTTTIAQKFDTTKPFYDLTGTELFLYPIPQSAVTGGLKMWFFRDVDQFTSSDTTQEPGFDRAYHEMIAMGASVDWSIMKGLEVAGDLKQLLIEKEASFVNHYGRKQRDRQLQMKGAFVNYK